MAVLAPIASASTGYRGHRKSRTLAESPHRVAQVLRRRFDQSERSAFTVGFLHRLYRSKAAQRRIARLGWIHAGFEVVLNLHLQVKANFVVQFALQPFVFEQATQPGGNHAGPTHPRSSAKLSGSKPRKRSIVDDIRLQSSVSFASRLRPAAVME